MAEIENIEDHIAKTCECGSVFFHLLKSGEIECGGKCQKRFGNWSELRAGVYYCKECKMLENIGGKPECNCGANKWTLKA